MLKEIMEISNYERIKQKNFKFIHFIANNNLFNN